MHYIIKDNKIAGYISGDIQNLKSDHTIIEGISNELVETYYDVETNSIKAKPAPPEGNYYWKDNEWLPLIEEIPFHSPDLLGMFEALRDTDIWNKMLVAGTKSLKLNLAVTLVITAFTATKSVKGLESSLIRLREALVDNNASSDFTEDEVVMLNELFTKYNINISL